jgi:vacuolar-type H+-ATPase subunit C/Vma6
MMELLKPAEDRGYPSEYLISRITGKRAALISDWTPLVFSGAPFEYLDSSLHKGFVTERSPGGIWRDLMKEYRWVYLRMNSELREIFRPFFLYLELRTIFICLRNIKGGKTEETLNVLPASLLSEDIKKILAEREDILSAVRGIEKGFLTLSDAFAGIADVCDREGLKGFERELMVRYLVTTVRSGVDPLMKDFFVRIIDSRNIISLYKFLMLEPKTPPTFIPHGRVSESEFTGVIARKDIVGIRRLVGTKDEVPGLSNVESALYRKITAFLRKAGRDPLGIGPILDYLWRISLETMNLSILYYGKDLGRETVKGELVY